MPSFRDFSSDIDDLKRGATVVVEDAREDGRTRAFVNTPLFERGGFVALLDVSTSGARRWSADEPQFIRDVADRTWGRHRPAHREERRAAEGELRLVVDALPLMVAFVDRSLP